VVRFRSFPVVGLIGGMTALAALATPAGALEPVEFTVTSGPDGLKKDLRNASALLGLQSEGKTAAEDVFSAARAEYGRLVSAAYAAGYYSPVVHVLIDGREAAGIAPLDAPKAIGSVRVTIDPGPAFKFSETRVAPVPAGTEMPEGFAPGKPAESGLVQEAVQTGVDAWRDDGHAKAEVASQDIVADHRSNTLAARVGLQPGPRLRFGKLKIEGEERMRERRIHKIAGLPEGEVFDPDALKRSAERLRRTGVFRSVTLTEDETITSPDFIGITATVVEEKRRRYSIGAEIASLDGMSLTGYWLHRNLMGGGERLKVEGEIDNIGAQNSGVDYGLGVTIDRPATLTPDTTLSFSTKVAHLDEEDYTADIGTLGIGFSQYFSEKLTGRVGLEFTYAKVDDIIASYTYEHLALPIGATWDSRDNKMDAREGYYLDAELRPYLGFGITDSGARLKADGRAYLTFGDKRPITLAARAQVGAIFGGDLLGTPRDYLFYSGGGGTVRGQPYQSLGIDSKALYGEKIGGMAFAALSAEVRARVTDTIGIVGFADAGYIGATDFGDSYGDWHAGAGLGLRYNTGFGPIRLDVAAPVAGSTGDGVQIYVGIGQSF